MKLKELFSSKKDITIAYLGGSITEAPGYRDIFTNYLRETYPTNNITEINAGIGGTNSVLGVARTESDIISKNPDIVVIDFSVNDNHTGEYNPLFGRSYEGILRKLAAYNPHLPVIAVGFTTLNMNTEFYDKKTYPFSVKIHNFLCEEYKIPYVNAGELLYKHINETNETMMDYTKDNVHPVGKGNEFYGNAIIEAIKDYDFKKIKARKVLFENVLDKFTLVKPEKTNGWEEENWTTLRPDTYLFSDVPGTEIEIPFGGTALGVFTITAKDSGNLCYSVDGSDWKEIPTWDKWAISFDRLHAYILERDLENKKHTVKFKVSENKEEQSEGRFIRIIALMAEKPE